MIHAKTLTDKIADAYRTTAPRPDVPLPVAPAPLPGAWADQAACKGEPVSWWYPPRGSWDSRKARMAKSICLTCPVRRECESHAVTHGEKGIWGGATESERRRVVDPGAS